MTPQADTLNLSDTLPSDSLAIDSVAAEAHMGMVLTTARTEGRPAGLRPVTPATSSWLMLLFMVLFVVVALRFRNNYRFIKYLGHNLSDTRARGNVFDETMRETSSVVLLNILFAASGGLLIYTALTIFSPGAITLSAPLAAAVCIGVMLCYVVWEYVTFRLIGPVFANTEATTVWLRGLGAVQSIAAIVLFPVALAGIFLHTPSAGLLTAAVVLYGLIRFIFISKTLRIFTGFHTAPLLFLYYLCTLEAVPLVIAYRMARALCGAYT